MRSGEWERSGDRVLPTLVEVAAEGKPGADPYAAAVERLFALLEENQIAIAALAKAWRHTSRALELTQTELAHTQDRLDAERQLRRQA